MSSDAPLNRGKQHTDVLLRGGRPEDYGVLVQVWRSAVDATHRFLPKADRDSIQAQLASHYFPAVRLTLAEVDGQQVAFAGTSGRKLEMLFVHDFFRGRGVGSLLLEHVILEEGIVDVDVNEQNPAAVNFYSRRGFVTVRRSARDDAGRPYPLVHMSRSSHESAS
jgi:putative acetyltransferase